MAKFLTGKTLKDTIHEIIWGAKSELFIVSPYIKLDDFFKKLFNQHINNPSIHITIVFGKNEGKINRSLSKEDFDYFKQFLNITIIYVYNLHAKYYGNEKCGMVTSINLYDASFVNNIEFGVYSEYNFLNKFIATADDEAWNFCWKIAEKNEVVFVKRPVVEKNILNKLIGQRYIRSDVLHDATDEFYGKGAPNEQKGKKKKFSDFPQVIELSSQETQMPVREKQILKKASTKKDMGYCIRTGIEIPFNPQKPFCKEAYEIWSQYENPDYPEKYCHKTGKLSNGKTSMNNPILNKAK